jgi:hypothetical protein
VNAKVPALTLGQKQELFSELIAKLILHMYSKGYKVRCGDFYALPRTPLEHKKNSQHYQKCAADLNLFKDGKFLDKTEDHAEFGKYWEALHPLCRWGGRYSDGNHYELVP